MKRSFIVVFALLTTMALKAQVFLIDDFTLSETEGAYGIYADINCKESNTFYIDMQAPNDQQHVQMKLWGNYMDSFIQSLESSKKQYDEWSKVAHDNNITSFSKSINVEFADKLIYFTDGGKWYFEHGVDLECVFLVSFDGSCYMVLQSDYMTSDEVVSHGYTVGSSYNFMSGRWGMGFASATTSVTRYCSGASLTFSSTEEIDMFIKKLYDAKQWKETNKKQGKLFKDTAPKIYW